MSRLNSETFESVWDALADTPEEAANWKHRSELMDNITKLIAANHWSQREAAQHCGITQPRLNELLKNRISRFSLDALVSIGARIGV